MIYLHKKKLLLLLSFFLFVCPVFAAQTLSSDKPADPADQESPANIEIPLATRPVIETPIAMSGAVLEGLDKIAVKVSSFTLDNGQTKTFGTLAITLYGCLSSPPDETPEAAAFLKIIDNTPGLPAVEVFSGFMLASSPALSSLEHPVYDIWLKSCQPTPLTPLVVIK